MTSHVLEEWLQNVVEVIEHWHSTLIRALRDGVIGLPPTWADRELAAKLLADALRSRTEGPAASRIELLEQ